MRYIELDTPALLIDRERLTKNLKDMQSYADAHGVALRPHTKTHKCPEIAKMQLAAGACGIAVAKVGEAEAMAEAGLDDLFIANEIVGEAKLRRIAALAKRDVKLAFGVDMPCQVTAAESVFAQEGVSVPVLVEIEVGENRSGVIEEADFLAHYDILDGLCEFFKANRILRLAAHIDQRLEHFLQETGIILGNRTAGGQHVEAIPTVRSRQEEFCSLLHRTLYGDRQHCIVGRYVCTQDKDRIRILQLHIAVSAAIDTEYIFQAAIVDVGAVDALGANRIRELGGEVDLL